MTALHRNPFHRLGATVRDNRQRIITLAEEQLLQLDHDECVKARSDLLNPRARLSAEVAWLSGVSPRRAAQLVNQLLHDPAGARRETGVPPLARANLLAASLEADESDQVPLELALRIVEAATAVERINAAEAMREINEDRSIAQFPLIASEDQVAHELSERRRYYRNVFRTALDRLEPRQLVSAMTQIVDCAVKNGGRAPQLVHDLVDVFEVEAQTFLHDEAENIKALLAAIEDAAPRGEQFVSPLVASLATVARNWDGVAQPVQVSMRARGTDHMPSKQLGSAIRSVAVSLFNEHEMLEQAKRITDLLQDVFAELPEFAERLEEDAEALDNIEKSKAASGRKNAEWARELTYSAEVGIVFKDVLSIAPDGVSWGRNRYPLDDVTRVRWGATRHSVNSIPTGTTYTIAFGDVRSEAIVECRRTEVFSAFVDRLWKAVGVRLLVEKLTDLRAHREWRVGNAIVRDDSITLVHRKLRGSELTVRPWSGVSISSASGALNIVAADNRAVGATLSYIDVANVHVLEHALRMAFKRPGMRRLSELLN